MSHLTALRLSVGLAVAIAGLRLAAPTVLELLDLKALDFRYRVRGPRTPGGDVVIVGIDERSLSEVGRWPWPRPRLGELIDRLSEAGAKAIGLDIILDQPDTSVDLAALRAAVAADPRRRAADVLATVDTELSSDARLAAAFRRSGRVVLGHFFELGGGPSELAADDVARVPELSVRGKGGVTPESVPTLTTARAVHTSVPALADAATSAGHLNVLPDVDGINRRIPLIIRVSDRISPALSVQLVRLYQENGAATVTLAPREVAGLQVGTRPVQVDEGGQFWIDYLGPPGTFEHVSAADVLTGRVAAGALEGKIVLVGFTALGFDEIATPFYPVVPGVQLQATAIDNMLRGRGLRRPRWLGAFEAVLVVVLGLTIGVVLRRLHGMFGWLAAFGVAALYLWGSQALFETRGLILSAVYPLGAIASCTLGIAIFRALTEEREKRKIRDAFRHYLNPEVTDLVARDPTQLRLGGERRSVTVFFSDIRDFTSVAEQLSPEALGKLLNEYLGAMTDVVFRHHGLLDKYIGDAIMAFWGAPISVSDHARRCCLAALDMRDALAKLQERWKSEDVPLLDMRIGINSGDAVVGNFGSMQRFSYTAMGDVVNVASRLEGTNKQYGTSILISEVTRQAIGDEFVCREIDRVHVKGRAEPVTIFELLGLATADAGGRWRRLAEGFAGGLASCRAGAWQQATAGLEALAREYPDDPAIAPFLERCRVAARSQQDQQR